jgi:hypothetical protein
MKLTTIDREAGENRRYRSVGRCIYCSDGRAELTDEHIIPFGLVGNSVIFESASCRACAKVTGGIEGIILQTCLGAFRARIEAPTRRPKKRRKVMSVNALRISAQTWKVIGVAAKLTLPIGEYPRTFAALEFPPPGLFLGLAPGSEIKAKDVALFDPDEMQAFFKRWLPPPSPGEGIALEIGKVNRIAFMRMLAKITHAYAVAEIGMGKFRSLLPDLILGRSNIHSYLIGGDCETPRDPTMVSIVRLGMVAIGNKEYLVAGFSLWPSTNTPQYVAVVGECESISTNAFDPVTSPASPLFPDEQCLTG